MFLIHSSFGFYSRFIATLLICLLMGAVSKASARSYRIYDALRLGNFDGLTKSTSEERAAEIMTSVCNPSDLFALRLVSADEEFSALDAYRAQVVARIYDSIDREPGIEASARHRLARIYELQTELIDSKSVYQVFKNRRGDNDFERLRTARSAKLQGLVAELNRQASLLSQEVGHSLTIMSSSAPENPDFKIIENAIDYLEQRFSSVRQKTRFELANCQASALISRAQLENIRTGRVLESLPDVTRDEIKRKWQR